MQSGIQLYSYWKSRIEEMGRIRTAWFTTYNLDISFFEKYILSALLGIEARNMTRPEDYETISQSLSEESGTEFVDVRLFYDARALISSGKPKLTTVDLHAIDPQQFGNAYVGGVFHPKVAIFENDRGQFWLLTGSFNMTLSGWARNRESFFLERVTDAVNVQELHSFFSRLAETANVSNTSMLSRLKRIKPEVTAAEWKFKSSFSETHWLNELNAMRASNSLRIWSPYFSDHLPEVISNLNSRGWTELQIIPATNESQKIRIEAHNFKAASEMDGVDFLRDDVTGIDPDVFVHGKVWLTSHAVALGSWNMTQAGMNIASGAGNNIEAGVLVSLRSNERQAIEKTCNLNALNNPICCDASEINDDAEQMPVKAAFVVDLMLDWEHRHISILSPSFQQLVERVSPEGSLQVPGLGQLPIRAWHQPKSIQGFEMRLLTDRYFTLKDELGQPVYQGYLRECGLSFRPVNGYQNLSDCMMSWMTETPERHSQWQVVNYAGEITEAENVERFSGKETHNYQGWFNAFYALECLKKHIQEAKKSDDKPIRLRKIGRVMPGNITEIKKHLSLEQERMAVSFSENGIYLWFIISKFNAIVEYYNQTVKDEAEFIDPMTLPEHQLREHLQSKYTYSIRQINQWKSFIEERLAN